MVGRRSQPTNPKDQYTVQEIYDLIENKEEITNDDQLYEALLDVMYATRPKGVT